MAERSPSVLVLWSPAEGVRCALSPLRIILDTLDKDRAATGVWHPRWDSHGCWQLAKTAWFGAVGRRRLGSRASVQPRYDS